VRALALLATVVLLVGPVRAEDDEPSRATLRGLKGVRIEIEEPSPELADRGITAEVLRADTELPLRQGGIPIDASGRQPLPGEPVLFVQVLAAVDKTFDQCSFGIRLELQQQAELARDHAIATAVTTWSVGGIGEAGRDWRQVLRKELAYYVGLFADAWHEANPPSGSN
jgi:hypothetical protein